MGFSFAFSLLAFEPLAEPIHMESSRRSAQQRGAGEAVILGALAAGVNKPTWTTLKIVLLGLGASLLLLLHVSLNSKSPALSLHVLLLIAIACTLFVLLRWFIAQTGLVSVDDQMVELKLIDPPRIYQEIKEVQGHID